MSDEPQPVDDDADAVEAIKDAPQATEGAEDDVSPQSAPQEKARAALPPPEPEVKDLRSERSVGLFGKAIKQASHRAGIKDDDVLEEGVSELARLSLEKAGGEGGYWLRLGLVAGALALVTLPQIFNLFHEGGASDPEV